MLEYRPPGDIGSSLESYKEAKNKECSDRHTGDPQCCGIVSCMPADNLDPHDNRQAIALEH